MPVRHLELDEHLACDHVPVLLVVGQLYTVGHPHPAVVVAVKDSGRALFVPHMHIFQPVQIVPAHHLHVFRQEGRDPIVIRHKVHVITIADMLADFLFALRFKSGGILQELVDILDLGAAILCSSHGLVLLWRGGALRHGSRGAGAAHLKSGDNPRRRPYSWSRPAALRPSPTPPSSTRPDPRAPTNGYRSCRRRGRRAAPRW